MQEHEDGSCGCGCGLLLTEARKKQVFIVDEFTCEAGRALDKVSREKREAHSAGRLPDGWDDGLHLYVRPHDPERDKPLPPARKPKEDTP